MLVLLAETAQQPRGSTFVDYIGLVAAGAVVLAGLMNTGTALWNARKDTVDRLDKLVSIYKDWPDALDSEKRTIEAEIVRYMDELKLAEDQRLRRFETLLEGTRRASFALLSAIFIASLVYLVRDSTPPLWINVVALVITTAVTAVELVRVVRRAWGTLGG
ncbi:hypothetical protein [Nocardia brasiliensis]|uniref:hypothetical protein n=1 Tax=Nocardia brasiliensis TaxID=37326 RepID=UPI0024573C14|nr:hypothetical protein [Nocardia brasiliensis]